MGGEGEMKEMSGRRGGEGGMMEMSGRRGWDDGDEWEERVG